MILIIVLSAKRSLDADYSALTEEIELSNKASKFKADCRARIIKYKSTFSKRYRENSSSKIFANDSVLKTNPWTYKVKDLNREKILGSFYEKELLFSKL